MAQILIYYVMRIAEINIPKGCKRLFIDQEENGIVITYDSKINTNEFYCKETMQMEERPGKGDFSIFWCNDERERAIVACLDEESNGKYYANDDVDYDNAIKFRDYEQYLTLRGIHE